MTMDVALDVFVFERLIFSPFALAWRTLLLFVVCQFIHDLKSEAITISIIDLSLVGLYY